VHLRARQAAKKLAQAVVLVIARLALSGGQFNRCDPLGVSARWSDRIQQMLGVLVRKNDGAWCSQQKLVCMTAFFKRHQHAQMLPRQHGFLLLADDKKFNSPSCRLRI